MAKVAKKNIDFNVYERQDKESQVDWGKAAQDITKTVSDIRDDRQTRKDLLEKNIEEQRVAINDIGEYDSQTLRDLALASSQQSADELAKKADLMRRGILKPNDMMQFKSKQSAGWTQFKNNAENWDAKFQEFTTRTQDGLNSTAERELAEMISTFGNLKNMKFLTDDEGNMAYVRTDDEGNVLPGESMSVNEMTNLLNQKINAYDAVAAADGMGEKIGVIVEAMLTDNGINAKIFSEERSRAESDFFEGDEAKKTLSLFAKEMTANPSNLAVMMVDSNMSEVKINGVAIGVKYENNYIGANDTQVDKHAAWAADNSDKDQGLNPYIKWVWNGNSYQPEVTEEQKIVGDTYAEDLIRGTLNIKQEKDTKRTQPVTYFKPQESAASIKARREDEEIDASGQSVNLLVSGSAVEAEAAAKDLISSFENLTDIDRVVDADGKVTAFNIKVKGKVVDPIKTTDSEGNAKTPDQLNREIFKLVGAKGTYDAWLKRNKVGENIGEGASSSSQAADEISYNLPSDMVVVGDSKITYDSFFNSESGGNLGSTLAEFGFSDDGEAEVQQGFTNLLDSPSFIPKGLKDFISKENGEIKVQVGKSGGVLNNQMVITIGNEVITYDDVYLDSSTGGTAGISQKIREAIEKEVKRANTGGGKKTKKKNVG